MPVKAGFRIYYRFDQAKDFITLLHSYIFILCSFVCVKSFKSKSAVNTVVADLA